MSDPLSDQTPDRLSDRLPGTPPLRGATALRRGFVLALLLALALAGVATLLAALRPLALPEVAGAPRLPCVSYAPFRREGHSPFDAALRVAPQDIEADLRLLAGITGCVRTYGLDHGLEAVPGIARRLGLRVMLGAWIGRDAVANDDQLTRALQLAREHADVIDLLIVGNEVLLRRELTPQALAALLARARRESAVPVAYADVWEFWLRHAAQLGPHVDRVAAHVLPYWEDHPVANAQAAAHVHAIARQLRDALAPLPVWVAETGWPAAGRQRGPAVPGPAEQTRFLRDMLARERDAGGAHALGFNLIEAFDQPWKRRLEGAMGGYWGFFDEHGRARVALAGPLPRGAALQPALWAVAMGLVVGLGVGAASSLRARRAVGGPAHAIGGRAPWIHATTLALVLAALAACGVLQWHAVQVWSRSAWETAAAVAMSAVAAAVALAELPGLARHLAGQGSPAPRRGWVAALRARRAWRRGESEVRGEVRGKVPSGVPLVHCALALVLLFIAAASALLLLFDGRYRPLLWPMAWVPAALWLASALLGRRFGPEAREERALAALLALAAPALLWQEGLANTQAVAAALVWLALAVLAWPHAVAPRTGRHGGRAHTSIDNSPPAADNPAQ
jgi:glucan 1,3-beta-glucosidase